jgi:hypothetical protein
MTPREPRKLDDMPDQGRVVLAHPSHETQARDLARERMCDYLLREIVPAGSLFWANVDQIMAPVAWHMSGE